MPENSRANAAPAPSANSEDAPSPANEAGENETARAAAGNETPGNEATGNEAANAGKADEVAKDGDHAKQSAAAASSESETAAGNAPAPSQKNDPAGNEAPSPTDPSLPRVGRKIEDFTLRDFRGAEHSLSDYADAPVVVVAFLGTECPLAKLYAPRLASLADEFRDRHVQFLGIVSNSQDSVTEMEHYARVHGINFPLLKDAGNVIADRFRAIRTPEVFLLDSERRVRYWGRVDDQYGIGEDYANFARSEPRRRDLAVAIEEVLSGRQVSVPVTPATGCHIGRIREVDETSDVTWSRQISRLFQRHCQECHRPTQIAPFPLLTYEDTIGWGAMIQEVVRQRRMPPWHADPQYGEFVNEALLTDEEMALIDAWVEAGCPEGDPAELPPPRQFVEGWQIPHPDQVVYMSEKPFTVPAEGIVEYQWFEVDPGFTEDKWIKAVEARPGNPAVVHHVTVYYKPPFADWSLKLGARINLLGGYSPGKRPVNAPSWHNMARYVPAGSKFIFEMHYTPNGTEQQDRSSIALMFADPSEVEKQLSVVIVANTEFEIPPGDPNYRVDAWYEFDEDSYLYAMSPHMHLRGKSFLFEAIYPDGTKEILLRIPRFDFNWQTDYMLTDPKPMPEGTRMHCVAYYDNSEDNLSNPDPTVPVRWGDQTWDEMMIGALAIAPMNQNIRLGIGKPPQVNASYHLFTFTILVGGGIGATCLLVIAWLVRRWLVLRHRSAGQPRAPESVG